MSGSSSPKQDTPEIEGFESDEKVSDSAIDADIFPVADFDQVPDFVTQSVIESETIDAKPQGLVDVDNLDVDVEEEDEDITQKPDSGSGETIPSSGFITIEIDDLSTLDVDLAASFEESELKYNLTMAPEEEPNATNENLSPEVGQSSSDATDAPAEESVVVPQKRERGKKKPQEKKERERKISPTNQDVTARLEQELEQEMRYSMTIQKLRQVWELLPSKEPDTVMWSVGVLEQSVEELEKQMESLRKEEEDDEDSEFKLRFRAQTELNNKLEEQICWYNEEVLKIKDRLKKGTRNLPGKTGQEHSYDADLDDMTEFELAKLVKLLERERNNLYGDLRSKSWLLDSQSKDYYHNKELIKAYTGDLNHINRSLEHFWRQKNREHFHGGSSPMTSPGSIKWNGEEGIQPSQRIIDPRKGPVRKTAGVRSLPRLDQEALEYYDSAYSRKRRTKSMTSTRSRRTKSVEVNRKLSTSKSGPRSAEDEQKERNEDSTSAEPTSEPSEDFTLESFASSSNN